MTQLIDRDEVIRIIDNTTHINCNDNYLAVIKKILSLPIQQSNELNHPTIISGGFQPDDWIDVKDRLPEQKQKVLTINIDGNINVMRLQGEEWSMPGIGFSFECITHWQSLPISPKLYI